MLLDPKDDNRALVADYWTRVEDHRAVTDFLAMSGSKGTRFYHAGIYEIRDPENRFFGYLISPKQHLITRVVDDKTIRVYDFPAPPSPP